MNIFEKLALVQQSLQVPKDLHNNFGGYNYRSAESILSAAKPLLRESGLILTLSDDLEMIGPRFYVKATATVIDTVTGEKIETFAWAREDESKKGMDSSQITGASSSYARKYALSGLLSLDDVKDPDAAYTGSTDTSPTAKPSQSNAEETTRYWEEK